MKFGLFIWAFSVQFTSFYEMVCSFFEMCFFPFLLYLGVSQFGKRPIFFSFCFCYEYLLCFFSFYVYFWIFIHDISSLVLLDFNFFSFFNCWSSLLSLGYFENLASKNKGPAAIRILKCNWPAKFYVYLP